MTLELHATPEEVMRAVEALQKFAEERRLPERTICGLALALEESACNIVNHGLQKDRAQRWRVSIELAKDSFVIELRDRGPEFDPTAAPQRANQAQDNDLPGGWGIQLVRRNVDEILYQRSGGENILRLVKKLAQTNDKR